MTLAVGFWKATVVVLAPLVAVIVLLALPCIKKLWVVAPTVSALVGVMVLAVNVPVTVAPPFKLAAPATASVPVRLAVLLIVWPFNVPTRVILPAGVTAKRLEPFNCKSSKLPVAPTFVLFTNSMPLVAWLLVTVKRPNVGALDTAISWMVFTTPPLALKFVLLNWAIPFCAVLAS